MKKILKYSLTVGILFIMLILVIRPNRYVPAAKNGIILWSTNVLPSLFPFFFFTLLLTKTGTLSALSQRADKFTSKHFRASGVSAYVFLMSVLSGYPIGARLISELTENNIIGRDEATRMSTFCSTSGPMFILATVGTTMFGSQTFGIAIFFSHIMSAVICGKIFYKYGDFTKKQKLIVPQNKSENILYESIYSAVISILCVGGFICIFYVFSEAADQFKLLLPLQKSVELLLYFSPDRAELSKGFCMGLIECTKGCYMLSKTPSPLSAALAASLISFGGISIIFQSLIYLSKAKIKLRVFLLSKTLQMIFAFILCLIFCLILEAL